ncbi:MAG TPA: lysophospholipid acyltransferase family protein [Candidatus Sulfotelmatobacter sp.]|nr:lysophospholipid acyltransferase family protein [Candidatus Sulfotelmatobacter sp.]
MKARLVTRMAAGLAAGMIAAAARLISGVQVRWVDSEPDTRQAVYFANHSSHLDFVVLWSSLPPEVRALTRPVAAQDYWNRGPRKALAVNVFRAVLVARSAAKIEGTEGAADPNSDPRSNDPRLAIEHMLEAMGENESLILFPEGTRGSGEEVAAFKSGLYYLCQQRPGLRLVPAYLNNLNRILPKGEFLPVPFISKLTFGSAMTLETGESKPVFLARAREAVCRLKDLG